ncbi:Taste receptor type 1 member 2 [Trichoplax sp. H2]|nr:Taste receptor type 1 member 2 [Trichoplax sp. H2]|eukprot:RDD36278.1 Taste receptor type 1 member 2 [Trichoplax sp. H2]
MPFIFLSVLIYRFIRSATIFTIFINIATSDVTFPYPNVGQLHSGKYSTVRIPGIFPNTRQFNPKTYTCSGYSQKYIQIIQIMIYTVDHLINNDSKLLPGIKVNYKILDSYSSRHAAVAFLTSNVAIFNSLNFQQLLSNNTLVSNHSSIASPLELQIQAIADIVAYFNWNWASRVTGNSDAFMNIHKMLTSTIRKRNVCISVRIAIHPNDTKSALFRKIAILKKQQRSDVIILVRDETAVYKFLEAAQTQNLKGKTFIGVYSWLKSSRLRNISGDVVAGTLGIDISHRSLQKYMN